MISVDKQLESLSRGAVDFVSPDELSKKIQSKNQLRVKLGVDPTSPDIHLGHTVVLQKLRQFQDLGHKAVLIIGDYTALVGDPSGTQKTRPQLSREEIKTNVKTYVTQIQKVLNPKWLELRYNGEWFKKMPFIDVIRLASRMTVARMLERDDFSKRFKGGSPISIHEFIYPLMQGYDSLMIKADVELGGTDQLFNLLVGRQLQKEAGEEPQVILTTPLLEGTDGIQKMSKSLNNYIGITELPDQIFGKTMSISDGQMWKYYELLSSLSMEEIEEKRKKTESGVLNPKDAKMELAHEFVARFYSKKEADRAKEGFERVFHERLNPTEMEEVQVKADAAKILLSKLILFAQCAPSHAEAKRLIQQGGVTWKGQKITDEKTEVEAVGEGILKVGKRRFKKIVFS
jgi:tyrosyl-tRNA synthetase